MKKKDVRDRFLSLVPVDARRILDVGCADGGLSATLRQKGAEIVGLEKNEGSCEKAQARLSKVFLADIEKFDLPYPNKYFDCILYADILAGPLVDLAPLLAERTRVGGRIALSGLLVEQADAVTAAYRPWFDVGLTRERDGWGLLTGCRRAQDAVRK